MWIIKICFFRGYSHMVNGRNGLFRAEPVTALRGWLVLRKSGYSGVRKDGEIGDEDHAWVFFFTRRLRPLPGRAGCRPSALAQQNTIFGFIAGMFVVVRAIEDTGLTLKLGKLLLNLSGGTSFGAVMVGTFGSALGTNLINNVPMAVVMNSSLGSVRMLLRQ
jgi:hypothetical protein